MKIETLDVVVNLSQTELQTLIDVLEAVCKEPSIPLQRGISTADLQRITEGLKEFKDLASKVHHSAYTIRPQTK